MGRKLPIRSMRLFLASVLLLAPMPVLAQDGDHDAVVGTIRTFFDAFAARDEPGMLGTLDPDGRLVVTGSAADGRPSVRAFTLGEFAGLIAGQTGEPLVETFRNPRVTIHDNLASVWLDYDLWVGDRVDHCGEDLFQLARTGEGWRITSIADTQRRDCEPAPIESAALQALWDESDPYGSFVGASTGYMASRWRSNLDASSVPADLAERAAALEGTWHVLVVAEIGCSDSADTIPHVARLVDAVPGADLRIIRTGPGRPVMEAYRSPDGRAATPTVVITNEAFDVVGCFVERPKALQSWAVSIRDSLTESEFVRRKTGWYDWDQGRQTMAQLLTAFERAATGAKGCSP